jgi:hypothetical protein
MLKYRGTKFCALGYFSGDHHNIDSDQLTCFFQLFGIITIDPWQVITIVCLFPDKFFCSTAFFANYIGNIMTSDNILTPSL